MLPYQFRQRQSWETEIALCLCLNSLSVFRSFGAVLEPRYIFGAEQLDQ
jgi:hypothetical protein